MAESCTQAVVKTAMQAGPIYFGERVHYFWSTCKFETRRRYMEAQQSVGAVVRAMLESDNFLVFPETPFRARFDLQYDRLCEGSTVCAKVCAVFLW